MRLVRLAAKALMILIAICETLVAWELWRHGPPMDMVVISDKIKETGELSFKMVRVSLRAEDYLTIIVVIVLQVALVVFLLWSRRKIV
jgi:hypothetical protein